MSDTLVFSSSSEIKSNPDRLLREIAAGKTIRLEDVGYTIAPTNAVLFADHNDDEEAADMVSLPTYLTGIRNTIFVSTKGYAQHAPRIKIAVDPPDSLNAAGKTASMTIHDFRIMGEHVDRDIAEQAENFIKQHRATLLDYWNCKINTAELIERLKG